MTEQELCVAFGVDPDGQFTYEAADHITRLRHHLSIDYLDTIDVNSRATTEEFDFSEERLYAQDTETCAFERGFKQVVELSPQCQQAPEYPAAVQFPAHPLDPRWQAEGRAFGTGYRMVALGGSGLQKGGQFSRSAVMVGWCAAHFKRASRQPLFLSSVQLHEVGSFNPILCDRLTPSQQKVR